MRPEPSFSLLSRISSWSIFFVLTSFQTRQNWIASIIRLLRVQSRPGLAGRSCSNAGGFGMSEAIQAHFTEPITEHAGPELINHRGRGPGRPRLTVPPTKRFEFCVVRHRRMLSACSTQLSGGAAIVGSNPADGVESRKVKEKCFVSRPWRRRSCRGRRVAAWVRQPKQH
jgi:hypothetical protein